MDIQLCPLLARVLYREEGACLAAHPRECVHLQLGHSEVDTASVSLQGQKWDLAICSGLSQWAVAAWLQGGEREMVLPQCPECDL